MTNVVFLLSSITSPRRGYVWFSSSRYPLGLLIFTNYHCPMPPLLQVVWRHSSHSFCSAVAVNKFQVQQRRLPLLCQDRDQPYFWPSFSLSLDFHNAVTLCKHCKHLLLNLTTSGIKTSGKLICDSWAVWSVCRGFCLFLWLTENRKTVTSWTIRDRKDLSRRCTFSHCAPQSFIASHPICVGDNSLSCCTVFLFHWSRVLRE